MSKLISKKIEEISVGKNTTASPFVQEIEKVIEALFAGQALYIGHEEYATLKGEPEALNEDGRYTKNSPKYREVRQVNNNHGWDGKTKGLTAKVVRIVAEGSAKELGIKAGGYAYKIITIPQK